MDNAQMLAQAQQALAMMTPEQRKKALSETLEKATPEERKQMEKQQKEMMKQWEKLTPEQRAEYAQQQQVAKDMGAFCQQLKPDVSDGGDPNKEWSTVDVLKAMAECPSFEPLHEAIKNLEADQQKATVVAFITMERALLEHATEADAAGLRDCKGMSADKKRNLLLLLWVLYRAKVGESVQLDDRVMGFVDGSKRLATRTLIQAQLSLPRQRWIKATLAVARVSALLVNELWSHDDEECKKRMAASLEKSDGGPYPKLSLRSRTVLAERAAKLALEAEELGTDGGWADGDDEPATCLPKGQLAVQVELTRGHAQTEGSAVSAVSEENPHGIAEAFWLFLEGIKPPGTPNVLIAAQPLPVQDVSIPVLRHTLNFEAPPTPDTYKLIVHIASTTVVGCDLQVPISFVVEEDDVPALQD